MARMSGCIEILGEPETVFDAILDEPSWNPAMSEPEWLTEPPVQVGTRYAVVLDGRLPMTVEVTELDRPGRIGTRTSSSFMTTDGVVTIQPTNGGSKVRWDWTYRLQGATRLLTPVFGPFAKRWERRNWNRLRDWVERRDATA